MKCKHCNKNMKIVDSSAMSNEDVYFMFDNCKLDKQDIYRYQYFYINYICERCKTLYPIATKVDYSIAYSNFKKVNKK